MISITSYRSLLVPLIKPRFFHSIPRIQQALQQQQQLHQQQQPPIPLKRNTVKPTDSRKTFLIDYYKAIFEQNEIILFVHRNNLVKADNDRYRLEIKEFGGQFTVIKNNLMKVFLRNETHSDPASKSAQRAFKKNKNKSQINPLLPLLKGPTGIISISKTDPSKVLKILKFLKSTNEKLFLIGGKIDSLIFNIDEIDQFKNLKNRDELNLELLGVLTLLSGAGLVRTLETTTQSLYMTLKSHENELSPKDESKDE